ncbi:OLC1v1016424C1 [Oldenlandia corymbosa var. corymbosa]|uniref:OLC1v1016424C1 n=1 Tax=Oldenlandia corymbosa var. corymbosa TaxID=529605 RepID=A0AAV1E5Q6_OLDCO|nr:OLC1v1016424C1 [Oldenlandia corymbosa var. corymbosa]
MEAVQFVKQGNAGGFNNFNNWKNQQQTNWNNAPQQGNYQRPAQPPGFHRQDGQLPNYQNQQRSNQQYIPRKDEWISVQNAIKSLAVSCKSLENQLAQIAKQNAERPSGSLPSDTIMNPKGNDQEQAKAVTLRSRKQLNQPSEKVTPVSDLAGMNKVFATPTDLRKCNIKGLRLFPRKKGWDFFLKHIRQKFITERGIGEDGAAFAYIKRHGWETFSNPLVKPRIQIVQEFYGNFHTAPRDGVFVKGISVNCSTEAIRAIWKLPRIRTDYREILAALHPNQPLEQAILSRLAKEGTSWEMDDQENPLGFPANALQTPDLNLWHHFICCNLMPTSYTAKVTYEMALLLAGVTFLYTDAESNLQQPLRMHKLDQKPPGASSSGQATSTPTPAGQLRQRDFNKQTSSELQLDERCRKSETSFVKDLVSFNVCFLHLNLRQKVDSTYLVVSKVVALCNATCLSGNPHSGEITCNRLILLFFLYFDKFLKALVLRSGIFLIKSSYILRRMEELTGRCDNLIGRDERREMEALIDVLLQVHRSENPGTPLVSVLLHDKNYLIWKGAMLSALEAKMKDGFVTGSLIKPAINPPHFARWKQANRPWNSANMVLIGNTPLDMPQDHQGELGDLQMVITNAVQREVDRMLKGKAPAEGHGGTSGVNFSHFDAFAGSSTLTKLK